MRKTQKTLLAGVVAAALAVPAPAFAIHDPNVPAGVCANSVNAVGIPSNTAGAGKRTQRPHSLQRGVGRAQQRRRAMQTSV